MFLAQRTFYGAIVLSMTSHITRDRVPVFTWPDEGSAVDHEEMIARQLVAVAQEAYRKEAVPPPVYEERQVPPVDEVFTPTGIEKQFWAILVGAVLIAAVMVGMGGTAEIAFGIFCVVVAGVVFGHQYLLAQKADEAKRVRIARLEAARDAKIQKEQERVERLNAKAAANPEHTHHLDLELVETIRCCVVVEAVPFLSGRILVDRSGIHPVLPLHFQLLEDIERIEALVEMVEGLEPHLLLGRNVEHVGHNEADPADDADYPLYAEEGRLSTCILEIADLISRPRRVHVDLPLVPPGDALGGAILERPQKDGSERDLLILQTSDAPQGAGLNELSGGLSPEDIARGTMSARARRFLGRIRQIVQEKEQEFALVRADSLGNVLPAIVDHMIDVFSYGSYTFYCPVCNASTLEPGDGDRKEMPTKFDRNTAMAFDPAAGRFRCGVCEGEWIPQPHLGHGAPLPVHRIKDELLYPTWDKLWLEHIEERRRVGSEIATERRTYLNKADEERTSVRLKMQQMMQQNIRSLREKTMELQRDTKAVENMAEMLQKYERLASDRADTYIADCRAIALDYQEELAAAIKEYKEKSQAVIDAGVADANTAARQGASLEELRHGEMVQYHQGQFEVAVSQIELDRAGYLMLGDQHRRTRKAVKENTEAVKEGTAATRESGKELAGKLDGLQQGQKQTNALLGNMQPKKDMKRSWLGLGRSNVEKAGGKAKNIKV